MYPSSPPSPPEETWPPADISENGKGAYGRSIPAPPTYLPPATPPYGEYTGLPRARQMRSWFRIPIERPIITYVILAVLVGIYAAMLLSQRVNDEFLLWGAKDNYEIMRGEWWRLITATFLHGPPIHMFLNGYALFVIGLDLEGFFGRARFAAIYFISALGGSVASFAFSSNQGVGASGAIFGLVGALAVYFGLNRFLFGKMGQAQFWNIIVVILINVGIGFSGIFPIDNSAHLGGLIVGVAVGFVLCPRYTLGNWVAANVREVKNTNRSALAWLAIALIAIDVVLAFFVALQLALAGIRV
jgi:rhomboid protease GluP